MIHEDIFYPSRKEELEKLLGGRLERTKSKAFIVPHMEMSRIASLYREVFSRIPDGAPVTALLPLHREKLLKDEGKLAFSPDKDFWDMPSGRVKLAPSPFPSSLPYESEEFSGELLAAASAFYCPHSALRLVWSDVKKSEDVRKLVSILRDFCDNNETYIVSSNLTEELKGAELKEKGASAIQLLESGEALLDPIRKGRLRACGGVLIETVSRLVPGRWKLIGTVPDEKYAAHAAFYRE